MVSRELAEERRINRERMQRWRARNRKPPKPCAGCGRPFERKSNRQKFCSDCPPLGWGDCSRCGKRFARKPRTTGLYCSKGCAYNAAVDARNAELPPLPCARCGTEFRPRTALSFYCSRKCAAEDRRRDPDGEFSCLKCGARIPARYRNPKRTRRYCVGGCRGHKLGARRPASGGYVLIKTAAGWEFEHRVAMRTALGRELRSSERVHHRNGKRSDNRVKRGHTSGKKCPPSCCNLELWKVKSEHVTPPGIRSSDYHCPGCRCHELASPS